MVRNPAVIDRPVAEPRSEPGEFQPGKFEIALLVHDECVRQGLTVMLNSLATVRGVRCWDDVPRTSSFPGDADFDLLILRYGDIAVDAADRLAHDSWRCGKKILLLLAGDHEDMLDAVAAMPSNGFLVQDELTSASLAAAIARVAAGDTPMPAMLANRLLTRAREGDLKRPAPGASLTPRERQVLELLVEGLGNKQIAGRLRISQHGVKRLVSNVLAKLNCPNRTHAVAVALTNGILARPIHAGPIVGPIHAGPTSRPGRP
jgi:DNA-binding NarL/FixJ family response regulator